MTRDRFVERRRALMASAGPGLILVRGDGPEGLNPNLLYLTGVAEPAAALLLAPGGVRIRTGRMHPGSNYVHGEIAHQLMFLPPGDPLAARWGEDSANTLESASAEDLGLDAILGSAELEAVLTASIPRVTELSLVRGWPAALSGPTDADTAFGDRLRSRFFGLTLRDGSEAVHRMRRVKERGEVDAIRRSIAVTAEALTAALRSARVGGKEQEVEAEITRVYRRHGGTHAFDPIVGSGGNALKLHYCENSGGLGAGELVLIDTGVSLDGYKSDITRTVPVDGRFSPRQREIYDVVLRALHEATAICKPGVLLGDIHARAFEVIDAAGYGAYFPHGTAHNLGLETHDVGDLHEPLEEGCVITVEPGVYIPDEGIGVRIEDDVRVGSAGPEILSAAIPKEPDAIESWIRDARG